MRLDEYCECDAMDLADLVRRKEVSPKELGDLARTALDYVDPQLNISVAHIEADDGAVADPTAPFSGVPFVLKDLGHNWAGLPCTMGSRIADGFVYQEDGPLAARFRQSGLHPIAIANSSEFGINAVTEPTAHGPTGNPWAPDRSPGGSSGGSAAAVAAGVVPIAHASDGGGSIRVPAAWCGVVGLKPSRARNPQGGGLTTDGSSWVSAQHVVSRSVRDTAAALDVTSGACPGDYIPLATPESSFLSAVNQHPKRLKIALSTKPHLGGEPDFNATEAVLVTGQLLENLGHDVVEATPEISYEHVAELGFELFLPGMIEGIEAISAMTGLPISSRTLEPQTLATIRHGRSQTALDFKKRLTELSALSRLMGRFMEGFDILVTPAVTELPPRSGIYSGHCYTDDSTEFWYREMELYAYSALFSLSGQPAISLPLHSTFEGLPMGVQFSAAIGRDRELLSLAGQLEAAKPWIHKKPPVHAAAVSSVQHA
ncbi:amidase [Coralliovum pocilloporae]|uniref:amidase n=1 Tax=Coralliovum pocilloporae TaxID=3066369 RepID=UPI003306CA06